MNHPSDLLRLSEAARYLGVSRRWLYRRIWSGELPASKVGGLYFIRKSDLDALVTPARATASARMEAEPRISPEPLKCGYCFRLLTSDTQIGDVCQTPDCEAILCADCWARGIRHCVQHQPDREERWRAAVQKYRQGELPVLLRSEQARFRELTFLERIRLRLAQITDVRHPLGDAVLSISDWSRLEHYEDDRGILMDLLGTVALDAETLARYPLNARLRYTLPASRRKKKDPLPPFVLDIRVLSHLETMVREGFDTAPFSALALQTLLSRLVAETESRSEARLVLLAATTGWDDDARKLLTGDGKATSFLHQRLLVYLYDMERGQMIYNPLDARLARYAEMLRPALPAERAVEAAQALERLMARYDSLTLDEALESLPYSEEVLRLAFERLADEGGFALITLPPEEQWALVRK